MNLSNTAHKDLVFNEIILPKMRRRPSSQRTQHSRSFTSGVLCKPREKDVSMAGQALNLLLASLPPACRNSLMSRLKAVTLPLRTVLYEPDETPKYAHFITSGIASIVSSMSDGATAEVGVWGKEGLVESFHLLGRARIPTRCFIQMDATALRMPFKELQTEFLENEDTRQSV